MMNRTKILSISASVLLLPAAALLAFGYWGFFTRAGNTRFDEMDGMIPYFALVAGLVLVCVSLALRVGSFITRKKERKAPNNQIQNTGTNAPDSDL